MADCLIDLSHPMAPDMSLYPGTTPPRFSPVDTMESHGFRTRHILLHSHHGTHLDAPSHKIRDGKSLDQFPLDKFIGKGLVIDCSMEQSPALKPYLFRPFSHSLATVDFLLIHTGHDRFWGQKEYTRRWPGLSVPAANYLASFSLKGIGVDTLSVDRDYDSDTFPIHQILLEQGLLLVENLTRLKPLIRQTFLFLCLPLALPDGDGCPVRAAAIQNSAG